MSDTATAPAPAEAPTPVADSTPAPAPAEAAPAPSAPDPEQSLDSALEAIWDKHNPPDQPRAKDGKFASPNPAAEEAPDDETDIDETTEITDQSRKAEGEQTGQQETAPAAIDPPISWSADLKAKWASIPPDIRDFIAKRESETHGHISRMGSELSQYRPLGELLVANKEVFERHNAHPVQGIAQILEVQRRLDADPQGTIAAIAQAYGVDLGQIGQPAGENQEQGYVDPAIHKLNATVTQLQRQLAERERAEQETIRQYNEAQQAKTNDEVQKWASSKPHFAEVKRTMSALIMDGTAANLDEAYDMACHAVPSVRAKLTEQQKKDEEANRRKEAATKVSEAKKAAPVNAGSSRRLPTAPKGNWDADSNLSAIYDRANAS